MKRVLKISLITLAGFAAVFALGMAILAALDWNRAKPWLAGKVGAATGRAFAIHGDLSLSWQRQPHATGWQHFVPWPHLRAKGVVLGNPDWATTGPDMALVRQVDFTISPLALLHRTISVQSLVLNAPYLVLEQGKGGRANWRFPKKESKSDWQFEIRDLGLEQGQVRYVDPAKKADFLTDIDTMADGSVTWRSKGSFNEGKLSGRGTAGAILSLQESNVRYPVKAELKIGDTTITIDGTLTNPSHASALDVKLSILGASMADLFPFTGVLLPETPKFSTEGRLAGNLKPGEIRLRYENFKGKVGASDLGGTLDYAQKEPRSELRGDVVSHYLDLKDLRALIGSDPAANKKKEAAQRQPPDKVLPVSPFKTDRWKNMDVQVRFTGEKIVQSERMPIDRLHTRVRMDNGVLSLDPLDFGIAGGRLTTQVRIDGRNDPAKARMRISARGLKLRELFPKVESMHASVGQIHGDAELTGTGNSIAALLGSSNGEIKAVITQGSVSKFILEAIGLNIGSAVAAKLFGDHQVQLNCMVADLGVRDGLMQTRIFVADTEDALIDVDGQINLATERMALGIHPDSKGVRIISLRSPLHVAGTFKKPDIGVDKGPIAAKAGAAAVLGTVAAPLTALLALVQPGPGGQSPCAALMERVKGKPIAPPPGKSAQAGRP